MNTLDSMQLIEWQQQNKEFVLIDVREDFEHQHFNIGGIHIALGDLHHHYQRWSQNQCIVVYCAKGIRSAIAVQKLMDRGFNNVYNLRGGVQHLYP